MTIHILCTARRGVGDIMTIHILCTARRGVGDIMTIHILCTARRRGRGHYDHSHIVYR